MYKRFLIVGGFSGAMAVALGAMGAHFLKSKLETGLITETNLQTFETAAKYQMYHSIVILVLALFVDKIKLATSAGYFMMAGIVMFSGSLYLLSLKGLLGLENINWVGPITPLGGLCFIIGWIMLGVAGIKYKQ
jgi:uncharacterized membrane protein YgdD (TMEM256/DUF423 family)